MRLRELLIVLAAFSLLIGMVLADGSMAACRSLHSFDECAYALR